MGQFWAHNDQRRPINSPLRGSGAVLLRLWPISLFSRCRLYPASPQPDHSGTNVGRIWPQVAKPIADPLLVACAVDAQRENEQYLFAPVWVIVSNDNAVRAKAVEFGIRVLTSSECEVDFDKIGPEHILVVCTAQAYLVRLLQGADTGGRDSAGSAHESTASCGPRSC